MWRWVLRITLGLAVLLVGTVLMMIFLAEAFTHRLLDIFLARK